MNDEPMRQARALLTDAPSWHELRRLLDAGGLSTRIGAAGLAALLAEWHARAAAALADDALAAEIGFWSGGGGFETHLKGYNALPPTVLVAEARRRGWFVRTLGSGGAIVNAPGAKPLVLRALV